MHADHCSELISFLFMIRYPPQKKNLKEKYTIYGPKGIKKSLHTILDGFGVNKKKTLKRIKIKEISDKKKINFRRLEIKAFEVKHSKSKKCLSYRVISKKKIFCYSGDSIDCVGLRNACQNADLAIVEATLPRSYGADNHIDGKELGVLAKEVGIKKLIVTHVADFYLPQVKKDIRKNYKGELIIAKDLMEMKI